jgi:putative protein kinase ArgK-like GTPase of G3E family
MMSTAGGRFERRPPPILVTTATTGEGVSQLLDAIDADRERARTPVEARRRATEQLRRAVAEDAVRRLSSRPQWSAAVEAIAARRVDPVTAAERLTGGGGW